MSIVRSVACFVAAIFVMTASAEGPVAVDVTVDFAGPSTRVVLTHSEKVVFAVSGRSGRVEILYAEPVRLDPTVRSFEDPIFQGWELQGGRTLILRAGPGFARFDSFQLRNPSRLVLDFQGSRDTGSTGGPAATPPAAAPVQAGTIIVIDPGHGGIEDGAIGPRGLIEKNVALDLARRLRTQLSQRRDTTVILTRDGDRHVPLDERTAIANHNRADLFLSIHLNASRRADAHGAETYYLSTEATDDEARRLAALENGIPGQERPTSPDLKERGLDLVLWDLAQNQFQAESAALAETVQREMNALTGTRNRGVRQAPFRVLTGATMPAILIEVGFISNPEEEQQLQSAEYRDRLVRAIDKAVRHYLIGLQRLKQDGS